MLKFLFWDRQYRRLRTLWRLLLHLLLLAIVTFTGFTVLGISVALLLPGEVDFATLFNAGSLAVPSDTLPVLNTLTMVITALTILISIWLAGRWLDRRRFADFGAHWNRNWWLDFGFGLGLGALLMLLIFLVELAAGWITIVGAFRTPSPDQSFIQAIITPVILFICVGIYEEFFSRGYHLKNMAEGFRGLGGLGPQGAIVLATFFSSAIFGLLHAGNPNATALSTFNIFLAGIFLALGYILTGELAIPIGLHMTWNFFQGNVFGFPVSGTEASAATIIAISQGGDPLITGGAFGPEAGLVGIGAMLLGALLIIGWVRMRYGAARLQLALTQPDLRYPPAPVLADQNSVSPAPINEGRQQHDESTLP